MNWLTFGGSLAAVLGLGGVATLLRLGRTDRMFRTAEEAAEAAAQAIAGFVPLSALLGDDGRAALVFGENLRVVVLKAHGARTAAREIAWRDVRATAAGLVVDNGERRFGPVLLVGVDNLDVRRLAPQLVR